MATAETNLSLISQVPWTNRTSNEEFAAMNERIVLSSPNFCLQRPRWFALESYSIHRGTFLKRARWYRLPETATLYELSSFSRPIRFPKERSRFDRWFHRVFYIVHGSSYRKKLFLMSMPVDRRVLDNSNAFLLLISVISEIRFSGLTVVEGRSLDLIVCAAR